MNFSYSTAMIIGGLLFVSTGWTQGVDHKPEKSLRVDPAAFPFVRTIDERYQSFQVGMSQLTGGQTWSAYSSPTKVPQTPNPEAALGDRSSVYEMRLAADLTNSRLLKLAAALGPFYVRYGGTTSNSVYFQDNDDTPLPKAPDGYSVVLTRTAWKRALDFAAAVDAKVLTGFAVSPGVRDSAGQWTPVSAKPWLAFTDSIGGKIYAAELFNEPNFPNAGGTGLKKYSPSDYARDFATLRAFVHKVAPDLKLAGPGDAILGFHMPNLAGSAGFAGVTAEQFMTADPRPKFDIVSYHFYGALSERCAPANSPMGISPDKALSEGWLARPDKAFQEHKALRDLYAPGAPIWVTETGAAACGGPAWQPTFLDTFRFLDTEARLAKEGLDAIFTHELFSGSNGVIEAKTFMPHSDYWAALFWRRLMGTQVLDAGPIQHGLHLYAHCLRGKPGGVTVLAINLNKAPATVIGESSGPADLYALSAPELESRTVLLNGRKLALGPGDAVPATPPIRLNGDRAILAPTSINFISFPMAKNPACTR